MDPSQSHVVTVIVLAETACSKEFELECMFVVVIVVGVCCQRNRVSFLRMRQRESGPESK